MVLPSRPSPRGNRSTPRPVRHRLLTALVSLSLLACILWARREPGLPEARSFVCGPLAQQRRSERCQSSASAPSGVPETFSSIVVAAEVENLKSQVASAREISEPEFWALVRDLRVEEALIASWSGKQLLARLLPEGELVAVKEESEVEDLRNKLLLEGVSVRYPASELLTQDEALEKAQYSSEGATLTGLGMALAVGVADSLGWFGAALGISGAELEGQSLLEKKSFSEVGAEDLWLVGKDIRFLERAVERAERVAEADFQAAEKLAAQEAGQAEGAFGTWAVSVNQWCQDVWHGLFANQAPGPGGLIEDTFMGLLSAVSLYSLVQMAFLKRKSNSWSGLAHTATGAMQIGIVLYAIIEERCLRESPGPVWAVATWVIFMVNNITMWPLLKYFRGTEVQRVLFKLAYSFIISFQGIHAVAWSYQYPWLYWVVMPYWFWSIKKLTESSDNILALIPDGTIPVPGLQEGARRRVAGIKSDTPTWIYSILNFAGAVFDNLYMAVYTWRGPDGFWGWSAANIPDVNDHLRTGLVKPAFGSLTISVLVFLATLVYRNKLSKEVALVLNVLLASVGPWLILYYHKLVDFSEPWQPELNGDWPSSPYLVSHFAEFGALLMVPLAFVGAKVFTAGTVAPANAEVNFAAPTATLASLASAASGALFVAKEGELPPPTPEVFIQPPLQDLPASDLSSKLQALGGRNG